MNFLKVSFLQFRSISFISAQSTTFTQETEQRRNTTLRERHFSSIFSTRQRQSSPMGSGTLDGSLAFYLKDLEESTEGKQRLPPPLLWGLDWALRPWENRHCGFLLSRTCFMSGQLNKSPYPPIPSPFPQTLNSIITEANSSSVHWVWLILSDPLLAAFFIFTTELTSLWDR